MLAHASREDAKKNWEAMRTDPEFQAMVKCEQTVEKVGVTHMRPTDFSAMK
jgi:transcriptional regulator of NAD metabolism